LSLVYFRGARPSLRTIENRSIAADVASMCHHVRFLAYSDSNLCEIYTRKPYTIQRHGR